MSKRYTDTTKYRKPFIRGLPAAYKLLWDYLYHDCDHAGVWIADFEVANIYLGKDSPVNSKEALSLFNADEQRIFTFNHGKQWFIPSFIEFQYGKLKDNNRVHISIISMLEKYGIEYNQSTNKVHIRGLQDPKDMDKEKEQEKEEENFILVPEVKEQSPREKVIEHVKEEIHHLYNRRPSTEWSDKELKQLKEVCKRQDVVQECAEIVALYGWYEYRRKDIITLLHNWSGEIDKARSEKRGNANGNGKNTNGRSNFFKNGDPENKFKPTGQTEF